MPDEARRVMVVTGSSGEIGVHLATHFLARGWTVIGVDKQPPGSVTAPDLHFVQCDLADGARAAAAVEAFSASHGAPDVLVNCAGRIANAPVVTLGADGWTPHDFALWDDVLASGLTSAFHCAALTAAQMLRARKRGVIVNISSVAAKGNPGQAAYSAAKAGLEGLTLALGKELGPLGIRVVAIAPGYMDTESTRTHVPAPRLAKIAAAVPVRRLGTAAEVAAAVEFVIANEYMNATVVDVNGGLVL
jgi:3-oxoacyl-[acyl-carrier protein] reductase